MSSSRGQTATYHFHECSDGESGVSDSNDNGRLQTSSKWYSRVVSGLRSCCIVGRNISLPIVDPYSERNTRRRKFFRYVLIFFGIMVFFGVIAALIYVALVTSLIRRLDPPRINSGLQHIVTGWKEPDANGSYKFEWRNDFSRDIVPKACHSHNDYWRSVPLYQALSAGCVGIEADIWVTDDNELRVSHSLASTTKERTLKSLYLDPLINVFTHRNVSVASTEPKETGLFDVDPNASVVLLIDFKTDGHETWPVLIEQLQPLREKNWLTYFDGEAIKQGPLTIVGTGNTPFDLVQQNNANRFIFFDAPLADVSNDIYNATNSYYASISLNNAIGRLWFHRMSGSQHTQIQDQIKSAGDKGLKSRYWDTPGWPINLRDNIWFTLIEYDVGILNVDDLDSATRWNWNWCVIAGIALCGNR